VEGDREKIDCKFFPILEKNKSSTIEGGKKI